MKDLFQPKKRGNYLELPLKHLLTGLKQVKLILLNLHPEYVFTVSRIFKTFLVCNIDIKEKKKIVYCRVSSNKQKDVDTFIIVLYMQLNKVKK